MEKQDVEVDLDAVGELITQAKEIAIAYRKRMELGVCL